MKSYEVRVVKVSKIQLDQRNPRFPPVANQREAIQAMLKDQGQKLVSLASEIYQNGLNPSSRLILFQEGGKYIDGDGNRRITALKLLETPSLAGSEPKIKKKFDSLLKKRGAVPSEVDCVIFKSREDAKHWISINHSGPQDGKGQIPWNAEQKDRFSGGFSIGLQALDLLSHEGLINNDDKSRIKKTTLDRVLAYKKVKEKLSIRKSGDHFTFGKINSLKYVTLALRDLRVDKVYTAQKGIEFVENVLDSRVDNEDSKHVEGSGLRSEDGVSPISRMSSGETKGSEVDSNEESKSVYSGRGSNGAANSRSRRSTTKGLTVFGGSLSLKSGHINNLYRDIEEIYLLYKNGKVSFSDDFIVIFRMSLRMLAETAGKEENKDLAAYLKEYFDEAKSALSQDERTSLSSQSINKGKIVELFQTGAHDYSSSRNEEQAIALSIILGAIIKITHGKH